MATTYTWKVKQLFTLPQSNNKSDVVVKVDFVLIGEQDGVMATIDSNCNVQYLDGAFTQFARLTEPQVISWVEQALDEQTIGMLKNAVQMKIDEMVSPSIAAAPQTLPWE